MDSDIKLLSAKVAANPSKVEFLDLLEDLINESNGVIAIGVTKENGEYLLNIQAWQIPKNKLLYLLYSAADGATMLPKELIEKSIF